MFWQVEFLQQEATNPDTQGQILDSSSLSSRKRNADVSTPENEVLNFFSDVALFTYGSF